MGYYVFLDHTADILVKAFGGDLNEAFAQAGRAYFEMITEAVPKGGSVEKEIYVDSDDLESLLVRFLSELIILFEVESFVGSRFDLKVDGYRLTGKLYGELYSPDKHGHGHHVKGISYHLIEIHEGTPSHVQVLFDI